MRGREHIGHGPARERCLHALDQFELGFERACGGEPAIPTDSIQDEGYAAGCVVEGRPVLHTGHLWDLGAGMGHALVAMAGRPSRPTNATQFDGWMFAMSLVRGRTDLTGDGPRQALESGRGRALWYLCAGEPRQLARATRVLDPSVWRGIGMAAVFTGGLESEEDLCRAAGPHEHLLCEGMTMVEAWKVDGAFPEP